MQDHVWESLSPKVLQLQSNYLVDLLNTTFSLSLPNLSPIAVMVLALGGAKSGQNCKIKIFNRHLRPNQLEIVTAA